MNETMPTKPGWKFLAITGWLFAVVLIICVVGTSDYKTELEQENERLAEQNEHLTEKNERLLAPHGTCRVDPGERVLGSNLGGDLSCHRLDKSEMLVHGPERAQPLTQYPSSRAMMRQAPKVAM